MPSLNRAQRHRRIEGAASPPRLLARRYSPHSPHNGAAPLLHLFISRDVCFLRHRQRRRCLRPHRSIDFSRNPEETQIAKFDANKASIQGITLFFHVRNGVINTHLVNTYNIFIANGTTESIFLLVCKNILFSLHNCDLKSQRLLIHLFMFLFKP
uniref:Uncharacterized protein n=1 Tax=Oryza rufipogon TaxID=4529 RepID=A0A0E0NUF6_ORYRU